MAKIKVSRDANEYRSYKKYTVILDETETITETITLKKWNEQTEKYYQELDYTIVKVEETGNKWKPYKITMTRTQKKGRTFTSYQEAADYKRNHS